jgi:hypothetical protein
MGKKSLTILEEIDKNGKMSDQHKAAMIKK